MSILRYEFKDNDPPWCLEPVRFSDFSLLVGLSGVGKTRTLNTLAAVCAAAQGRNTSLHDCRWKIEVKTDGGSLTWSAVTAGPPPLRSFSTRIQLDADDETGLEFHSERRAAPVFTEEIIEDENHRKLVVRDEDGIRLLGSEKPIRMKGRESVISLLQEEETVAPLYRALGKVHRSRSAHWSFIPFDLGRINQLQDSIQTFEDLQNTSLPMGHKAFVLQNRFPDEFANVLEAYREIFPKIEKIKIGPLSELRRSAADDERSRGMEFLGIAIEESGVKGPILWDEMSAGMRRTLRHLLELSLAPRGTVILVDEYENSMGVNCLEAVTEFLLEPTRDLQLIITSHHPYVINNVPLEHWGMVTRRGSTVRIVPASEIPALDTRSKQDAFIRLLSAAEYLDGIQ